MLKEGKAAVCVRDALNAQMVEPCLLCYCHRFMSGEGVCVPVRLCVCMCVCA